MGMAGAVALLTMSGCVFETDRHCGPNQELQQDGLCRCVPGTGIIGNECVKSPVILPPPEAGLGAACNPPDNPCTDPAFPSCEVALNGDKYCTFRGCTTNDECPETYYCDLKTTPGHCRRPYRGQGAPCTDNTQCVGFDASVCATLLRTCAVVNCPENACDPNYTCFDASALMAGLPKLCVPTSVIP